MSRGVYNSFGASQTCAVIAFTVSCDIIGTFAIGILFEFGVLGSASCSAQSGFNRGDLLCAFSGQLMASVCIGTLFLVTLWCALGACCTALGAVGFVDVVTSGDVSLVVGYWSPSVPRCSSTL